MAVFSPGKWNLRQKIRDGASHLSVDTLLASERDD
jgi:hypothetical protein